MRALPLCLSLCLFACQKDAAPAASPDKPKGPPLPADVIAVASVRSLSEAVGRVQQYLDAVHPGAGAEATPDAAVAGLAAAIGATSLDGIALDRPMHVIVLDPKRHARPLLLLGHGDAARVKVGEGAAVKGKDGGALVGDRAGVDLVADWALGSLLAEEAPASPTVRASLRKLVELYRPEIEQARQSMGQAVAGASPGIGKVLQLEMDLLLRLAAQTDEMRLVIDASATEASFELRFTPTPGSAFEAFNRAQRPASAALLSRLPETAGASMVMAADYELGPLRGVLFELLGGTLASWAGTAPDAAFHRRWDELFGHFKGPIAVAMIQGGASSRMQQVMEVDDGAKTVAAMKALFPWNKPTTIDVLGMMKMQVAPQQAVATHDGVAIDGMTVHFDLSSLDPMTQKIMRQQYGEAMTVLFAGFDRRLVLVTGTDALADMRRTIDVLRHGPDGPLPGGARPAFAAAAERKASYIIFMNMAASMAAMTGRGAPATSGISMELGFPDGRASMRIGVPAAHVRDIKSLSPL
jgi:hypothetical protein